MTVLALIAACETAVSAVAVKRKIATINRVQDPARVFERRSELAEALAGELAPTVDRFHHDHRDPGDWTGWDLDALHDALHPRLMSALRDANTSGPVDMRPVLDGIVTACRTAPFADADGRFPLRG